jgi:hypothetical protein
MKTHAFLLGGLAALALAAPVLAAPTLTIRHAAISVVIEPENRSDIAVDLFRPNSRLPLEVVHEGADVVIDGHLVDWLTSCHGSGDNLHVLVMGNGDYGVAQMPQLIVHVPMDAVVDAGGIIHGSITRSQSLTLRSSGCQDWTLANVAGDLNADVSGVGNMRTGASHTAEVSLSGAGHMQIGQVETALSARLSGAGGMTVRQAGSADYAMSGSGSVDSGPVLGALSVRLSGAGSLKVASASGPVSAQVSGVGNVDVEGGHAANLLAEVSGTGHIAFRGVADSLNASVSGVGSVEVAKVTGQVIQHVSGIGSVHVGD